MPSPNGYLTAFSYSVQDRQSFRVTLNHDTDSPPWLPGQAGSYTLIWETGPTAAGPWTAAPLTDLAVGCTPQPDSETTVGGITSTIVRIGDPTPGTGMTADTDYHVRVTVLDPTDTQVDQWVLDTPAHTPAYPTLTCVAPTDVTETSGTVNLAMPTGRLNFSAPCNTDSIVWEIATTPGGPYTAAPAEAVTDFTPSHTFTGLAAGTTYYYRARVTEQAETAAEYLVTPECSFTTEESTVTTPSFDPQPCATGGSGADAMDVENNVLCDLDAQGNLLGTALAIYTYDSAGALDGAPTFIDPATGNPYTPQGTLQVCPDAACLPPMQFCQTSTTSGPVEHPGRQYDLTLPINQGFAVDSLQIDAVSHAAGITWSIFDVDGDDFAADLQSFIQGRMPAGATVTVNNPNSGAAEICGAAQPMQVHIECIRLDQSPPNLIELVYNGGEDLVRNPGYNTTPPTDLSQFQFYYLQRQDAGGTVNCTSVANRGWETNDLGPNGNRDFEIWGTGPAGLAAIQNTTPTPRGTPVQEVTADINDTGSGPTIWQTFNVPAPGNFRVQLVHGARDPGETHTIRLSTGDTDDTGPGDIINDVTTPASVTNSGGPNPWTILDQTVPLNSGEYTFSFTTTTPVGPNRGGLFTDMRVYVDRPGERATAVTDDDTCVVTTDETSTNTICSFWQPQCVGGTIGGWQKVDTGETLTNAEFWAQVPAPGCCLPDSGEGEGGSSTLSNMIASDIVCATVGGIPQNAIRVMVTDPSGGTLQVLFLGTDGAPIAPDTWTAGPCTTSRYMADQVLCDDNGPFLRKYVQSLDATGQAQVNSFRDFNLGGGTYTVTGEVRQCGATDVEIVELCDRQGNGVVVPFLRRIIFDANGTVIASENVDPDGNPYVPTGTVTTCSAAAGDVETTLLCDVQGDGTPVPFLRSVLYLPGLGGFADSSADWELDGTTPYVPTGTVTTCASDVPDRDREVVCWTQTSTGDQVHTGTMRHDDTLTGPATPGWILFDQHQTPVLATEPGLTFVSCADAVDPVATTGLCLADGTPIAVVVRRGSVTGTVTQDGWLNLTTGAFTAGAPPVGTIACGESRSIQVSGTFCDVDANGDVLGLVLIEYTYAPDGTIASVRLVDATTGATYTPTGTVSVCPSGTDTQPEQDLEVLCDVNAGVATPFIRDFRRDENGAIVAVSDYTLAGAAYTPTGTVGLCQPTDCETQQLCDVQEDVASILPSFGVATEQWHDLPNGVRWMRRGNDGAAPGGWYGADAGTPPERFDFDRPVSITYTVRFSGPTAAPLRIPAGWYLDSINTGQHTWDATTRTISPTGAATQAGLSTFRIEDQTAQTMIAPVVVGVQPAGQTSQYGQITATADQVTPFLRTLCRESDGTVTRTDTALDGTTVYTVLGTADRCPDAVSQAWQDNETVVLCDSATTPNRFLRTYTYNSAGGVAGFTDTTLAGAPFTPTGDVGICTQPTATDFDFAEEVLCDANGTSFIRRFTFNSATGAVTTTTNLTLAGAAFAPVGAVGPCANCCPQPIGEGCTNVGSGRYTAIRAANGTVTLIDSVSGATVTAGNIVACPGDDTVRTLTAQHQLVVPGTPWTPPAGATLTSLTYVILTGTGTVVDASGDSVAGLPVGLSATFNAEDDNTLTPPQSITSVGGQIYVHWTAR